MVWGLGRRYNDYDIDNTPTLAFVPGASHARAHQCLRAGHDRAQRASSSSPPASSSRRTRTPDWSTLPDLRVVVVAERQHAVVGRGGARHPLTDAVRRRRAGARRRLMLFIAGDPDFRHRRRSTPSSSAIAASRIASISWSLSAFYDEYDDLRTIEPTPVDSCPLRWGNLMEGSTYGVEVWAQLAGDAVVAPVARLPLAAQAAGVQRGRIGACWASSRRATIRPRAPRSSRRWTSAAGPSMRCCVMSESCRRPRIRRTPTWARACAWRASDALELSLSRVSIYSTTRTRVRGAHGTRDPPLRLRRGALDF